MLIEEKIATAVGPQMVAQIRAETPMADMPQTPGKPPNPLVQAAIEKRKQLLTEASANADRLKRLSSVIRGQLGYPQESNINESQFKITPIP